MKLAYSTMRVRSRGGFPLPCKCRQQGASLIVSLLMLIVVLMLGMSAAQISLQNEKAARNDRDQQIALQAAEAALVDAERDIENSVRSHLFAYDKTEGFVEACANDGASIYFGLCLHAGQGSMPMWWKVDFETQGVSLGHFTGRLFQTGEGAIPVQLPRYIIELMSYNSKGDPSATGDMTHFYRITAIGFGMRKTTRTVLQTFYRKYDAGHQTVVPAGRFSWREIQNWQELHDASM